VPQTHDSKAQKCSDLNRLVAAKRGAEFPAGERCHDLIAAAGLFQQLDFLQRSGAIEYAGYQQLKKLHMGWKISTHRLRSDQVIGVKMACRARVFAPPWRRIRSPRQWNYANSPMGRFPFGGAQPGG